MLLSPGRASQVERMEKIPQAGGYLLCLKNNKEISMARAESARGREEGDEWIDYMTSLVGHNED